MSTLARRTGALAGALGAVVGVVWLTVLAGRGDFWQDDVFYLLQAQERTSTLDFLKQEYFGQFGPLFRAWYLVVLGPLDLAYWPIVAAEAVIFLLVLAQLWRLLRRLCGPSAWHGAVVAAVATTALWTPTMLWPADALHVLPCVLLVLVGLELHLRWMDGGRIPWLVALGVVQALALGFWAKGALLVADVVLVQLLLVGLPRAGRRRLAVAVGVLVVVCAAYGAILVLGDYSDPGNDRSGWVGLLPHVAVVAWFSGFWPGWLGVGGQSVDYGGPIGVGTLQDQATITILVGQLVLLAGVAATVLRRRAAWRAWAFVLGAFLVEVVVVTYAKPSVGGALGRTYRYWADFAPIAALGVGCALAGARGWAAAPATAPRRRPTALVAGVAALLVLHAVLFLTAAHRIADPWPSERTEAWVDRLRADVARVGGTPAIDRGKMDPTLMASGYAQYADTERWAELWAPAVRVDPTRPPRFHLDGGTGALGPFAFRPDVRIALPPERCLTAADPELLLDAPGIADPSTAFVQVRLGTVDGRLYFPNQGDLPARTGGTFLAPLPPLVGGAGLAFELRGARGRVCVRSVVVGTGVGR